MRIIVRFLETVGLLGRGKLEDKLNSEQARILEALEQHPEDKVEGELVLKVKYVKLGDRIDVRPSVDAKLPKEKAFTSTTFWPLENGLSVQHPSQIDMFGPRAVREGERDFA